MAGGWARDGAVQEQIDASIQDELKRMQANKGPVGESPPAPAAAARRRVVHPRLFTVSHRLMAT